MKSSKIVTLRKKNTDLERQGGYRKRKPMPEGMFLLLTGVSLSFVLTLLLMPSFYFAPPDLAVGEIAERNVRASQDFLAEDVVTTEKNRKEADRNSPYLYDLDSQKVENLINRVSKAFNYMKSHYLKNVPELMDLVEVDENLTEIDNKNKDQEREVLEVRKSQKQELWTFEHSEEFLEAEKNFRTLLGTELTDRMFKTLRWHHYKDRILRDLVSILGYTMRDGIVHDKTDKGDTKKVVVRIIGTEKEKLFKNLDRVIDLAEVPEVVKQLTHNRIPGEHRALRNVVQKIAADLISPNLTFNRDATEKLKRGLVLTQESVFFNVKKGEVIVREGEPVSREHIMKVNALASLHISDSTLLKITGKAVFVILFLFLFWEYLNRFHPDLAKEREAILLLGFILAVNLGFSRFSVFAIDNFFGIAEAQKWYYYMIPFAAGPVLVSILFSIELTIVFSILNALLIGFMIDTGFYFIVVALAGGLVAVTRVNHYRKRSAILRTGFLIGMANLITIIPVCMIDNTLFTEKGLISISCGMFSGFMVAVFVSALLPLIESVFHYTSDIKLLELSDPNHPLLSQLAVKAPGTYHHSVMVGHLSEKAAEAVGGNPLLCRVASYYHDVGKLKKPEYFIENQMGGTNRHDSLTPSMSALIISSHVKEGTDLAKEYRIVPKIINIIREHHGTNLMAFFYNKAKQQENASIESVNEGAFRYGGPKPSTKEAAIILLADSVEAASRTLTDPTHSRLKGLVKLIIEDKIVDGQLDNSHLSFNDIHLISESFLRVLPGFFHTRIKYPKPEKIKGEYGNSDSRFTKECGTKFVENKKKDPKDLRSLKAGQVRTERNIFG